MGLCYISKFTDHILFRLLVTPLSNHQHLTICPPHTRTDAMIFDQNILTAFLTQVLKSGQVLSPKQRGIKAVSCILKETNKRTNILTLFKKKMHPQHFVFDHCHSVLVLSASPVTSCGLRIFTHYTPLSNPK